MVYYSIVVWVFHYFSVRYGAPLVRAQRLFYKFDIV